MNRSHKRCWAEIDLAALRHNAATFQSRLGKAGIMAVVKANAYGHGAAPITRELAPFVAAFGVANLTEAIQIAEAVEPGRVHILGAALPGERAEIARRGFVALVSSSGEAAAFAEAAAGNTVRVTAGIDTGMGRIGIDPANALAEMKKIAAMRGIAIGTIATHLPMADEDESFTRAQLALFDSILEQLRGEGIVAPVIQVLNSAGAIHFPGDAYDLARIGLALYGSSPVESFQPQLRPVMALKTRVTIVRDVPAGHGISYGRTFITPRPMRIATLAAGYADGYQRHLSGSGAEVLIGGRRCPLLGRVTMDQVMVDVSTAGDVEPDAEAVLIGRQGAEEIAAAALAREAGTVAWEIFTGISARVERIYLHPAGEESAPPRA